MQQDKAAGKQRSKAEYVGILQNAGHAASTNSAAAIVAREAKRILGAPLGRGRRGKVGRPRGRKGAPFLPALRERLESDRAKGELRTAGQYVHWVVGLPGVKMGLIQARPVVYRELRRVKQSG